MKEYTVRVYDERTEWQMKGKLHREDGPALEWANGTKEWYENGQRHRTDGPALERASGCKAWWENGKLHRTDGPAFEGANGTKEWYFNGKPVTEQEHKELTQRHTIVIDGKEIHLSHESYQALKKSLT